MRADSETEAVRPGHGAQAVEEPRIIARYRLRCDAGVVEDRAQKIAVEQSVEMPLAGVRDPDIMKNIVGKVLCIQQRGERLFDATIGLSARTVGADAGQLLNMLLGNSSMHEDVSLEDAELPPSLLAAFGGPNHGIEGLRALAGVERRALTCSALKPQGLSPAALAELAHEFALGGADFIKDDHGLADQDYAPFAERAPACARAMREAAKVTGRLTHYVPSLWGSFEEIDARIRLARDEGLKAVMVAPALIGVSNLVALTRKHADFAFFAHPSFTGGARIAQPLYNKLYRLFGADAVIYATFGGRFGYSRETCRGIADGARKPLGRLRRAMPVPAGGLTLARVKETLDFYGEETMLLIGGDLLLSEREALARETAAFVRGVENYGAGSA
ncbi:RuBisCO large subunit C-terminal-like domain-containing protein [Methylocystis bryophila]|uniref:RuBisCO large subunit C-terminal-like domain-containing protein n=1 Tax=Methylocystis bryophila TaxID=655015 RepID=UPI001FD9B1B6|nr:RuBisCO large subunit C-terminal-like domain-containing protein [Methylocystis bryophila]BDV39897.1 ribulose-bisphosphate carboxylase [Methylocystis bryophila]